MCNLLSPHKPHILLLYSAFLRIAWTAIYLLLRLLFTPTPFYCFLCSVCALCLLLPYVCIACCCGAGTYALPNLALFALGGFCVRACGGGVGLPFHWCIRVAPQTTNINEKNNTTKKKNKSKQRWLIRVLPSTS